MQYNHELIYGERTQDLLPGLFAFGQSMVQEPDGMWKASVTLASDVGRPLVRALMRSEAELLIEDADGTSVTGEQHRAPDQRRADAFVRIVESLASRSGVENGDDPSQGGPKPRTEIGCSALLRGRER
jgi:hypothetical protein